MPFSSPASSVRSRAVVLACACGIGAWFGLRATAYGQAADQVFRASVDLIAVDVQVTDGQGRPVTVLGPDDFEVTLDGRKRCVVSAAFTKWDIAPDAGDVRPVITPVDGAHPDAARDLPGRTFVVAVDSSSFRALDVRVATLAAERFIRRLNPQDRVGVLVLPEGPRLAPTTSHARARQLLGTIVGRKAGSGQFEMSVEEVIDVTAAMANQSPVASRRTIGQILTGDAGGVGEAADSVACSGPANACTEQAMGEAVNVAMALEREVLQGIAGLDTLLRELQQEPGRKTVLLLSGGMPVSDRSGGRPSLGDEVKRLGERATYANATINAIYFDPSISGSFSVGSRRSGVTSGRASGIHTRALAEFAGPSGGMLLVASTGIGESEIDRIVTETSAYYVLGVEPDARDRDGRPHRLRVRVDKRDVNVRSRQLVIVPRSGP